MALKLVQRRKVHNDSICCLVQRDNTLYSGGEDGAVSVTDLRTKETAKRLQIADTGTAVPSIALHPTARDKILCCHGSNVAEYDLRGGSSQAGANCEAVNQFGFNTDEVNCVAINAKGTLCASADDTGSLVVIDLAAKALVKRLDGVHKSIASCVSFRRHKPWELVSGGLDSTMLASDFSAGKVLRRWSIGDEAAELANESPQVCNPPMVHSLALPESEDRCWSQYVACARGDGVVAIYTLDPERSKLAGRKTRSKSEEATRGGSQSPWHPVSHAQRHASAVTSLCFSRIDPQRIVSGGNDGLVVVQQWSDANAQGCSLTSEEDDQPWLAVKHGRKVNSVCASDDFTSIYVADVTSRISCYRLT